MTGLNNTTRKKFIKHVYKRMKEITTGSCFDRIIGDKPQVQFFVGTLCNQDPRSRLGNIRTKVAPVRMGAEFLLSKREAINSTFTIRPLASVFYKVNPTYAEVLQAARKHNKIGTEDLQKKIHEQSALAEKGEEDGYLGPKQVNVFKKLRLKELALKCSLKDFMGDNFEGETELEEAKQMIAEAFEVYDADDDAYMPKKTKKVEMDARIPLSALKDERTYDEFIKQWGETDARPAWDLKLLVKTTEFDNNNIKVSVIFENTCVAKENDHIDNFLFDTHLNINVEHAKIQDFIIDYLNDHYRYDGNIEASGINCEAKRKESENTIFTEHLPFFEQSRIKTNENIKPKFDDLASKDCTDHLRNIAQAMKDYLEKYKSLEESVAKKSDVARKRFKEDLAVFENEIKRFEYGVELIDKYPLGEKAFRLMNQSFANASRSKATEKSFDSWRVFQIIFIVMNLPDVLYTEYEEVKSSIETVEVLYFPTGGGKTETYLGLSVFTLFFDRLRGKDFGVSIMIKFPLRLLSLQQIQRVANILAQAELIRRENSDMNCKGAEEFSLGYYVGDRNTPNKLMSKGTIFGGEDKDLLTPIVLERESILKNEVRMDSEDLEGRKYLIITKCPFCGSKKIMIDADVDRIRLMHRCMNKECKEDVLPIYISDMEIYRHIPSFIISTLDKIAICGLQKNFRNLFGQVTHKCPLHGYSNSEDCTEKWLCKADKSQFETVQPYDPIPTLQIQDELHLVRESLGTFNSHYESFLEHFEKKLTNGKRSMKILTATATISEYKIQTDHLYCKDAVQYPSQGPSVSESFYSSTDKEDMTRLVVGLTPHFKTKIFSVLATIETYHSLINGYYADPSKLLQEIDLGISEEDAKTMLEDYKIKLSYHLAKNDGDSISNSIRTMTNKSLRDKGLPEISQRPLTGDVSFNDVRIVLDLIENPPQDEAAIDLVIATSMISHGVDVDKMNFMSFMGMPHNTAEYIQASSRVGRKFPALVFVVFNPTRERDQSYFKFFSKFHEFKDLLVEAVPINRWAKFSVDRTLPGIFTGAVLNYFDAKSTPKLKKSVNMSKWFDKALDDGLFTEDDIKEFILKSYKVSKDTMGFGFDKVIIEKTETYIHEIRQALGNQFITGPMSDKPMTSLRDVDVPISINLSPDGMMILKNIRASRTVAYDDNVAEEVKQK